MNDPARIAAVEQLLTHAERYGRDLTDDEVRAIEAYQRGDTLWPTRTSRLGLHDGILASPGCACEPCKVAKWPTGTCVECHTEGPFDEHLSHLSLCYWCAELQRINPHPTLPSPLRMETIDNPHWSIGAVGMLVMIIVVVLGVVLG